MHMIKKMSKLIDEELDGAEHYIRHAIKYKEEHPSLAKAFFDFSNDELVHVDTLQKELTKYMETWERAGDEGSADMKAICDYLRERNIDKINEIRIYQDQYKGY